MTGTPPALAVLSQDDWTAPRDGGGGRHVAFWEANFNSRAAGRICPALLPTPRCLPACLPLSKRPTHQARGSNLDFITPPTLRCAVIT